MAVAVISWRRNRKLDTGEVEDHEGYEEGQKQKAWRMVLTAYLKKCESSGQQHEPASTKSRQSGPLVDLSTEMRVEAFVNILYIVTLCNASIHSHLKVACACLPS